MLEGGLNQLQVPGFSRAGATVEAVKAMLEAAQGRCKVKSRSISASQKSISS